MCVLDFSICTQLLAFLIARAGLYHMATNWNSLLKPTLKKKLKLTYESQEICNRFFTGGALDVDIANAYIPI